MHLHSGIKNYNEIIDEMNNIGSNKLLKCYCLNKNMGGKILNELNVLTKVNSSTRGNVGRRKKFEYLMNTLQKEYQLYLLILPTILYIFIFNYVPMYGIVIAFKDFVATKGILGSPWVGFEHFQRFFQSPQFWLLIKNTLGLSLYSLIVGFPMPIILALFLNQTTNRRFKRIVQTVTYAPHFISIVVMAGMIFIFLSPTSGLINNILKIFGNEPVFFMGDPKWFKTLFVSSGVWQGVGWGAIIYLSALSGVNPELYEASTVDGANKWHKLWHIDLPSIAPMIVILFILNAGQIMNIDFQKAFLLQNSLNLDASEIISTYIYKVGLLSAQYSYSTAIGLFNTIINVILLLSVNYLAKACGETSLW